MSSYLVKFSAAIGILVFLIHCAATAAADIMGSLSAGISASSIAALLYEKWLWRINPLERTPRLANSYECVITFNHDKGCGSKSTFVYIEQTLHSIRIRFKTDEIRSNSTSAQFAIDAGSYYLEYVYATDPKAEYRQDNQAQNGAARLMVETKGMLHAASALAGSYWMTSLTSGDMELRALAQ